MNETFQKGKERHDQLATHVQGAVEWLLSQQEPSGRFRNRYAYNGKTWVDIDKQGQISKWVTLRACSVLKMPGLRCCCSSSPETFLRGKTTRDTMHTPFSRRELYERYRHIPPSPGKHTAAESRGNHCRTSQRHKALTSAK
jgi:hypothetical protein